MKNLSNKYISAHLFYGGNLNFLLKKGVEPFIKKYKERFGHWFFIRYNEDGQHIRLRLYVAEKFKAETINLTTSFFDDFFEKYPSTTTEIPYEKYPNNSIQLIDYLPEIERYGGKTSLEMMELAFHASSDFILKYLEEGTEYESALMTALMVNLHLVRAYSPTKMVDIYEEIYEDWLTYTKTHLSFSTKKIEKQFEAIFQGQQELLTAVVKDILEQYQTETMDFDELYTWKKLAVPFIIKKLQQAEINHSAPKLLKNLVHLNNNRLGISNFDEPLLAYLTLRCLTS